LVATFEQLVTEASAAPVSGWDFSWLKGRATTEPLPWSYLTEIRERASTATALLDMGTGGGEVLSSLAPLPRRTVATEAWRPNIPVAARRLRPLGIGVVQDEGAPDNYRQNGAHRGRLPFRDGAFSLVANRHEAFRAAEVSRVLAPGGTFVTRQVDFHSYDDLYRLLNLDVADQPDSWLPLALQQVEQAGLIIEKTSAGEERQHFHDVGAVVYYLRVVSWAVPEFSLGAFRDQLHAAWRTPTLWPFTVRLRRFLLIAAKPRTG
jgi:SAM-dependent methyltransferase